MKTEINRASRILVVYSLLLVTASFFSIPFPFVRQIWIREIWGVSGLIHALIFFIIKIRIEKASLAAGIAGLGLVLNEQILAWRTFLHHRAHEGAGLRDGLFLFGSVSICLFLAMILISACKAIYKFREERKTRKTAKEDEIKSYEENDFAILVAVVAGYAFTFVMLFMALSLEETARYGIFKILASIASVFAFGGIGQEINLYAQAKQTGFFCAVKALSHVLLLFAVLWVIYHKLPVANVII